MDGRVDKFHVYVDGEPQFGSGYIISKEDFDKAIEFKREKIKKEAQQEIEKSKNIKITEENFDYAQRLKEQL